MATIKFIPIGKNELLNIYVRLLDGKNTDLKINTGFVIEQSYWNKSKNEVIDLETLKPTRKKVNLELSNEEKQNQLNQLAKIKDVRNSLEKLKVDVTNELRTSKAQSIVLNREWLENVILKSKGLVRDKELIFIIDIVKAYQDEMKIKINPKSQRPIADTTIRNFNTTIKHLTLFEKFKKKRYLTTEIDLTFHSQFISFLKNNLTLAQNTISKDIKQIKTVCVDAKSKGIQINEQVLLSKFNAPLEQMTDSKTGKKLFVTINEQEIEMIKTFKGADYLENAKDWLIIGCWTGCRVGDLMQLSMDNIQTNVKGQKFIRYTQSKTGKQVDIPLHNDVLEILARLGGFPRAISDQRFNEWIKTVCKNVGMTSEFYGTRQNPKTHLKETGYFEKWELVRSHTCRRSFATNNYHKFTNKQIMAVTGHSTEKMLLNYIGETENDHIDDFLSVWNNANKKDEQVIQLSVKTS